MVVKKIQSTISHLSASRIPSARISILVTHIPKFGGKNAKRKSLARLMSNDGVGRIFSAKRVKMPDINCSMSHCKNHDVVVRNSSVAAKGIGVDVEYGTVLPNKTGRLFLSRKELSGIRCKRDLLRLWTIKEAIFKADVDNNGTGWFSEYELMNPRALWGRARKRGPRPAWFRYISTGFQQGFISVAVRV